MRILVQKQNKSQEGSSVRSSNLKLVSKLDYQINPGLHLQRALGNQVLQRMPHTPSQGSRGTLDHPTVSPFGYEFSQIPIHPEMIQRTEDVGSSHSQIVIQRQTEAAPDLAEEQLQAEEEPASEGGEPIPDTGEAIQDIGEAPQSDPQSRGEGAPEKGEEETQNVVQRKADKATLQHPVLQPAAVANSLGQGQPIEPSARVPFERFFGHDFSRVRVHSDHRATNWSNALGARAFTVGHQIAFGTGEYAPHTRSGQHLLAHELTHVVQQSRGQTEAIAQTGIGTPGDRYEIEADRMADRFVQGKNNAGLMTAGRSLPDSGRAVNRTTVQWRAPSLPRVQSSPRTIQLFSGSAAASYARKWATSTNPKYGRMSNDCTNFVSQAMLAGGWKMEKGWYRSDSNWWFTGNWPIAASWTWGGAHNFSKFVQKSGRGSLAKHVRDLRIGDVLQMSFSGGHINHSMVVTKKTKSNFSLSYHTSDTLDRNFYGKGGLYNNYKSNPKVEYFGWRIS